VPWLVLDLALVLLSLVVLALLGLRLWRQVKELSRGVSEASTRIASLTQGLSIAPRPEAPTPRTKAPSRVG